jgi:phosphatidylinositol alpha-mannosyltransferase
LVVVGEGPGRSDFEDMVRMYNIPDVTFTGWVDDETKIRCFASADIFCAPATGSESFGIVLLEAMSSGTPVLASAIPGYSQVVTPGVDGLLVTPRDISQWERAIETLADNADLRRRFSEAGRQHAITCDWSKVSDRVLEVYAEAKDRASRHFVAATAATGA